MKVEFTGDVVATLLSLAARTKLGPAEIVRRILGGHLAELTELDRFMEHWKDDPAVMDQAENLMVSYGPESLMDGIKRIKPDYQTTEDEFLGALNTRIAQRGEP